MRDRRLYIIRLPQDRIRVARELQFAQPGTRVEIKGPQRTIPQNDKLHAAITDIAEQLTWHGRRLTVPEWKSALMELYQHETGTEDMIPSLDNERLINIGRSTSDLSKLEGADFIELIYAFGAQHGVVFHEPMENENGRHTG